jgi:hypothetical protein
MTRLLSSLAAITAIAGILVGAPALLLQLGQLPGFLPSLDRLAGMLLAPDSGRFLLVLIWAGAWLLWAWLAALILIETVALLRGVTAPRLPAAALPQGLARALVVAAAAAFIATPLQAGATPPITSTATTADTPSIAAAPAPTRDPRPVPPPPTAVQQDTVTVAEGDTLWDLADKHLGDPTRWPELYEANKGTPQPFGYTLQDPDQIDIGWTLTLPTTPAADEPVVPRRATTTDEPDAPATSPEAIPLPVDAAPAPAPEPAEPEPAAGHAAATTIPSTASTAAPSASPSSGTAGSVTPLRAEVPAPASDDSVAEAPRFAWEVAGLLGAGTFLGVGVGATLTARCREQFRTRRPGRMITPTTPVVAPIEQTAQLATGLSGLLVARLDQVLRRLDPATTLTAVTVSRDATIHLHTPNDLTEPWQPTPGGWLLPNTVPVETVGDFLPDRPCPWPLLVTIGADNRNRVVLYNLDHAGTMTITGDEVMAADFARYLAAELAVNPWSDGIRIACHGPAAHVIGMAPHRLDAHLEEIVAIASTNTSRALHHGVTAAVGRAGQVGDDTWTAAAIITDDPDQVIDMAAMIAAHPQQTGTAIITLDPVQGEWVLTPAGRLHGHGFELTAVGLTDDEAAGCADLLAAHTTDTEPPLADELVDATGNLLPEHRTDREANEHDTVEPVLPEPDQAYIEAAVVTAEELAVITPRVPETVAEAVLERDPDLDAQVRAWFSPRCPYPRLTLLGPVAARCHGTAITKKAYYTEALAYLALHPHGVTGDQVAAAFGIKVERARTVMSTLRQWLGTNPRTGAPHIPDAKNSAQAKARGVGLYLVEDLLVDADLFRRLRTRALTRGRDGIEDLETALRLVTGRPFDQLRPAGWTWLIDGDRVDHHMTCAVTDVAHILVTYHLKVGDLDAAKRAATIALRADPNSEIARLDLAGIMVHEGHTTSARQILADALGDDADLDLTPRATEILNGKNWLKTG